jgi:CrcB protein
MSAVAWAAFVIAGAVGAPLRYVVDRAVQDRAEGAFPWGTLVVNLTGSFLFGFLTGIALYHAFPTEPKVVLGTGFLGAYTTFSNFTFETVRLLEEHAINEAIRNIVGTLITCAVAAAAGIALAAL